MSKKGIYSKINHLLERVFCLPRKAGVAIVLKRHLLKAEPSNHASEKSIALWHLHKQISDTT